MLKMMLLANTCLGGVGAVLQLGFLWPSTQSQLVVFPNQFRAGFRTTSATFRNLPQSHNAFRDYVFYKDFNPEHISNIILSAYDLINYSQTQFLPENHSVPMGLPLHISCVILSFNILFVHFNVFFSGNKVLSLLLSFPGW